MLTKEKDALSIRLVSITETLQGLQPEAKRNIFHKTIFNQTTELLCRLLAESCDGNESAGMYILQLTLQNGMYDDDGDDDDDDDDDDDHDVTLQLNIQIYIYIYNANTGLITPPTR